MARVNVLIPVAKKAFLRPALQSVLNQTHTHFSVVLSDDSPGDEASAELRATAHGKNVSIFTGPKRGVVANMRFLLSLLDDDCEFVHFLFDDDLIFPTFHEQHIIALEAHPTASCSLSPRWLVDADGQVYGSPPRPVDVARHSARHLLLPGKALFQSMVPVNWNWLGEFSNSVWRRPAALRLHEQSHGDISFYGLSDIGHFLLASHQHPVVYCNEHLGAFRTHGAQTTNKLASDSMKCAFLAWGALGQLGRDLGSLDADEVDRCLQTLARNMRVAYQGDPEMTAMADFDRGATSEERIRLFDRAWRNFQKKLPAVVAAAGSARATSTRD